MAADTVFPAQGGFLREFHVVKLRKIKTAGTVSRSFAKQNSQAQRAKRLSPGVSRSETPQNQNRKAVLIRARDRSGILLAGLPGKRYKRIARFFAAAKNAPKCPNRGGFPRVDGGPLPSLLVMEGRRKIYLL
jgi:hypothetical protein